MEMTKQNYAAMSGTWVPDGMAPAPSQPSLLERVVVHIAAHRKYTSGRLLDVCYGPSAKPLRTAVMAMILGHKVTGRDKCVQWGAFREALLKLTGMEVHTRAIATEDREFEERAATILAGQ